MSGGFHLPLYPMLCIPALGSTRQTAGTQWRAGVFLINVVNSPLQGRQPLNAEKEWGFWMEPWPSQEIHSPSWKSSPVDHYTSLYYIQPPARWPFYHHLFIMLSAFWKCCIKMSPTFPSAAESLRVRYCVITVNAGDNVKNVGLGGDFWTTSWWFKTLEK